jgi:hypothetical protein
MMDEEERTAFYETIPLFMHHCPHMYIIQQNMILQQQQHQQLQKQAANAAAAGGGSTGASGAGNGGQKPVPVQGLGPGVKGPDSVRTSEPEVPGSGTSSSSSTTPGMTIPQAEQALILNNMLQDPNTRIKMSALSDRVKGDS